MGQYPVTLPALPWQYRTTALGLSTPRYQPCNFVPSAEVNQASSPFASQFPAGYRAGWKTKPSVLAQPTAQSRPNNAAARMMTSGECGAPPIPLTPPKSSPIEPH